MYDDGIKEALLAHVGHDVEIVTYGDGEGDDWNVSLECNTCGEVIIDRDLTD